MDMRWSVPSGALRIAATIGVLLAASFAVGAVPAQARSNTSVGRYTGCVDPTTGRIGQVTRGKSSSQQCEDDTQFPIDFSDRSVIRDWAQGLINDSLQGYAFGDQHCGEGLFVAAIDENGAIQCLASTGDVSESLVEEYITNGPIDLADGTTLGGQKLVVALDLQAETKARIAGDAQLQTNLDTEAASRDAADTTLQANLDAEAAARDAADTTLQTNIDAEASQREIAYNSLVDAFNMLATQLFAQFVPNGQTCPPGNTVTGFDPSGMVVCQPTSAPTLSYQRVEQSISIPAGPSTTPQSFSASCPAGLNAVGGGFNLTTPPGTDIVPTASYADTDTSWAVTFPGNPGNTAVPGTVSAVCVALQ